jgi:hypothetical protein
LIRDYWPSAAASAGRSRLRFDVNFLLRYSIGFIKEEDLRGEAAHHARLWKGAVAPLAPEILTSTAD